ncbi:MAG: hypothetical protein HY321_00115 [Armatimonadetes bacterium]|nr:hypothetical protein [Armatimonadota bacterium]
MATVEELEERVEAVEAQMAELRREVARARRPHQVPWDGTIHEWLAAMSREAEARPSRREEIFRELGIPTDLPPATAEEIREMMIADGVRPEERLAQKLLREARDE